MPQTYQQRKINKTRKEFWFTKQDNERVKRLAQKHNLTELQVVQIALSLVDKTNILDSCDLTVTPTLSNDSKITDESNILIGVKSSNN